MLTDDDITTDLANSLDNPDDNTQNNAALRPFRMELFSPEQRHERGQALGHEHHAALETPANAPTRHRTGGGLLTRLHDNENVLRTVHRRLVDEVNVGRNIPPVAEWIVDNFYVIEEQVSLAERHLPRKYLLELPRIVRPAGPGKEAVAVPRVYDLAEHIVAYGDSRVEVADLGVLVAAYQEARPLRLGELWALPIMLRLALIENIRRMAAIVSNCQTDRENARKWAEHLTHVEENEPGNLVLAVADMARAQPRLSGAFVAELKRRLQGRGQAMRLPLEWVEQNLGARERTLEQAVNDENHEQAILEISMRNCVTSLRSLNVTDWNEFVETMSGVERILRKDPGDVYGKMDFATRDMYRRVVERLAKHSGREEVAVAASCLDLARNAFVLHGARSPEAHVGFYLIGHGERELRRSVGYRGSVGNHIREASTRWTLLLYLGAIAVLTVLFTAVTVLLAQAAGVHGGMLAALGVLLAFTTGHLAVGLVNLVATQVVRPRALARLDFRKGIPSEMRTLMVVPLLLKSEKDVGGMLRNIESHYLNNRGRNVHFGLLTDFTDSDSQAEAEDAHLVNLCRLGIIRLNERYPDDGGDNFFLFHRARTWNAGEEKWMGRERKRGKLEDLNRYLRGSDPDAFDIVEGATHTLANVRYVITLDADTFVAKDAAEKMVGAMAHPLNQPRYSRELGRVASGHGILQPRVDATIPGANRSLYARLNAGDAGIDPYTFASSDVYQDLFDEGSYIGKGIYDVETSDRALGDRFPENQILSHDLLEGCVVRSGLLADVKLYEDPPTTYLMDMERRHRWIRGDWQIAHYILTAGRRPKDAPGTRPLNILSRWKIFDNLRRSLTPVALFLLVFLGLAALTKPGLYALIAAVAILGPVAAAGVCELFRKSPDKTIGQHLRNALAKILRQAAIVLFRLACLPFEAWMNLDAIVRSLWRQCVSKKHLLQWKPSDNRLVASRYDTLQVYRRMWPCPAAAAAFALVVLRNNPGLLKYALPLAVLWFLAPLVAARLSRPRRPSVETLSDRQKTFLRGIARSTWSFFETFVNADENWLPPDNFQEQPEGKIAHRTSPTNMGLSLLANLSAYDFGYVTAGHFLDRTANSLATMAKMERYRGHFLNWYDTRTLAVLRPAYVSSVDSGNLAAHALVVASGLRELAAAPAAGPNAFSGFVDTLALVRDAFGRVSMAGMELARMDKVFRETMDNPPATPAAHLERLDKLEKVAAAYADKYSGAAPKAAHWLGALVGQIREARRDAADLFPWAEKMRDNPDWAAFEQLQTIPSLFDASDLADRVAAGQGPDGRPRTVPAELAGLLDRTVEQARRRLGRIQEILVALEDLANIEYDFLYNKHNRQLRIGFNVEEHRPDSGYYDLMASEARLAAYLAIAQNKIPQESWFALGRTLTLSGRRALLISWSGSMFEYLMPLLVMPEYEGTLLDETYKACVQVQMDYAASRGVPWGVSESGYHLFDSDNNYQYRAFGVPELGLRHTLAEDLVIAPYASALAAMVFPRRAAQNLQRLASAGYTGRHGFYEAVDFTASRMEPGRDHAVIRSYMAHHQGMTLAALGQTLLGQPMHRRFRANPLLSSASLLLQEIVPSEKAMYFHSSYSPEIHPQSEEADSSFRILSNPASPHPEVQLLSNGQYHVMVTSAGGGYSRWRDLSLTRWREDATRDNWGMFCYIRDRETGETWSNTHQPTRQAARSFEAVFSEGKAEFHRRGDEFDCRTEIVVAPDDDVEVRRLRITNKTARKRTLDVTSYMEVALAQPAADESHPAFSKLFVETRLVPERQAVVCSRRPRNRDESTPPMFHMLAVRGTGGGAVSYETDRLRFLGRGRDASNPIALSPDTGRLGGGVGAVLDPVAAIRSDVVIEPGDAVVIDMITGVSPDPARLDALLEKYQDERSAEKAFDFARPHGQLFLRQLGIDERTAGYFCRLASSVVFTNPILRADPGVLLRNRKGQSGLWGYAISGDLPIVLVRIADPSRLKFVDEIIQAHNYWRRKGLAADLVVWNEDQSGYRQNLHDQIVGLAGAVMESNSLERPGGIFVRSGDRIADEDRILLLAAARVVISDSEGMLEERLRKIAKAEQVASSTLFQYRRKPHERHDADVPAPVEELAFPNGYGGFSQDGREYVVVTDGDAMPPLPWVNVIANARFGSVVSESGASYTWSENSHEFRLSPWQNDPVSDSSGEAFYLRDEDSGEFWSPAPYPCRSGGRYVCRHGFGYSRFFHNAHGIHSAMTVHVDKEAGVKFVTLNVANHSRKRRSLSLTGYVEWVLGESRSKTAMQVTTGVDTRSGALFARNHYNTEFRGRTAFLDVDDPGRTVTGDRREFIGRNGDLASPLAMQRSHLSGRVGPGLDPCGAAQVKFSLAPGQARDIVFRLGAAESVDEARKLMRRFRGPDAMKHSFEEAERSWRERLDAIQVETPDKAFDFMANGWLPYQALACRFWGRSATYQSGGAFGFRDQLQDSLALVYAEPALVRAHILESASRQFVEGDVQHWWHPPAGRGVRTRCSDDYLWLPYVACQYAGITGDTGVFDEKARFLEGRPLGDEEESYYDLPVPSEETASLYEHCKRAIGHGLRFGPHGLPLMGSGDWNDGMDMVGIGGKGESVWLAFFLHEVLRRFEPVARDKSDNAFADSCAREAALLAENIGKNAWDDTWYRRAYFDDGTPLGSAMNDECRIDSIAQSWAVISGVGDDKRARSGMRSLARRLVDGEHMVIKLFEPPFDRSGLNPGYIKGYVPGVRENGGQYTHAAVWAAVAFAKLGDAAMAEKVGRILNPVNHALSREAADVYKIEPYVIAADVYANPAHQGRGGWSWYTGSASWMYRFMLENVLGFDLAVDSLRLNPCVPADWNGYRIRYRRGHSVYDIRVTRAGAEDQDNAAAADPIRVSDDSEEHVVEVKL